MIYKFSQKYDYLFSENGLGNKVTLYGAKSLTNQKRLFNELVCEKH